MRYASGTFEGMFYVGVPLALFALLLPRLDRLLGGRVGCSALAGIAAAPLFALSSFLMAQATNPDPGYAAHAKELATDVDSTRKLVEGKTIFVSELDACGGKERGRSWDSHYYFTGSVFVGFANRHLADFVVSERVEGARTLTPGHRLMFLYDPVNYDAALGWYERQVKHGVSVLESPDWDVHLVKGSAGCHLLYFDDHCPQHRIGQGSYTFPRIKMGGSHVFLHAWPYDANDLPAGRRRFGFDDLVRFQNFLLGWRKDGECYALCRLPDYGIARVSTGWATRRLTGEGPRYDVIWEGSFSPDQATKNLESTSP